MTMTHLPTGHPEIEPDPFRPDQTVDNGRAHVTHHRLGGLSLDAWTHTRLTGEPYHRSVCRIHADTVPGSVSAQYVAEMGWDDSDETVPAFVAVRIASHEPHQPKSEIVAYLSVDLARTLHDALSVALTEHDFA